MKRYDTVIFDLDGTLLNTLDDLANSINHALKTVGFPERTIDEVRRFVGDGALELARRASPAGTSEEMVNQVLEQFRLHYSTHSTVHTAPYPGIFDLMDALKNAPADKLRLEFTSGVAPCVILPAEGEEKFVYMVLPVRLKAN